MGELADVLDELGVDAVAGMRGAWMVRVPTERRGAITVELTETERTVALRAFLLRGPEQGHEAVYRRLLAKNLETRHWRLALDGDGDIVAAADVMRSCVDTDTLDGLLGAVSALVDEIYAGVLSVGFGAPTS